MSEKRTRGRPPLDATDRSVTLSIKLPARQCDRLYLDAARAGTTVAELLRKEIKVYQNRRRE